MEALQSLMNTEIYNGKTLSDLITLEFLAELMGNVLAAVVILVAGFIVASWVKRRIVRLATATPASTRRCFTSLAPWRAMSCSPLRFFSC